MNLSTLYVLRLVLKYLKIYLLWCKVRLGCPFLESVIITWEIINETWNLTKLPCFL